MQYEQQSLDVEMLQGLKTAHGIPDMSFDHLKKWKNNHSVKDMTSTATSVMTEVVSQKIGLTGHDGEYYNNVMCFHSLLIIAIVVI